MGVWQPITRTTMKPITLLTALLACSLGIGTADAKGNNRNRKPPVDEFKKLDKNHDGLLSPEELGGAKGKASADFAKADKNHDGFLDRYEYSLLHKNKKH